MRDQKYPHISLYKFSFAKQTARARDVVKYFFLIFYLNTILYRFTAV